MDQLATETPISTEVPAVLVVKPKPAAGRRWFGIAAALGALALVLAVVLVAMPLHSYIRDSNARDGAASRELDCRNLIGNALQDAQADVNNDVAEGFGLVLRQNDTALLLTRLDDDRAYAATLSDLRRDAIKICHDDPSFVPPPHP